MSRFLLLIVLFGSSVTMTRSEPVLRARSESVGRLVALPVALDPTGGARTVGALRFVSGWELRSADPRFGGISALALTREGFVALSDSGTVMWIGNARGRPSSLRLVPLADGPGNSEKKADRDSEAIAFDPAGRLWVTYERHNEVWRYSPEFRRGEAKRQPPEMRHWRPNSGAEAMARLPDGRFLIFSEGAGSVAQSSDLLLLDRDPTDPRAHADRMNYRLPEGFAVTDAALLGGGRIMTLHRSFSVTGGVAASLGVAHLSEFRSGALVAPRIVATLRPPLTVDNMEALAIERRGGKTYIWIASDDNFSTLQRTLLMQFALDEKALTSPKRR